MQLATELIKKPYARIYIVIGASLSYLHVVHASFVSSNMRKHATTKN